MLMQRDGIKKLANDYAERAVKNGDDIAARELHTAYTMGVLNDYEYTAVARLTQVYINCKRDRMTRGECAREQGEILKDFEEAGR